MSIINEYLETHPLPWRVERRPGCIYANIYAANNTVIDFSLKPLFAECVVELVNSGTNAVDADAIAHKDVMLGEAAAKIEELRKAPTPTPVPTPEWRSLGSLASMEYTDSVLVEREREKPGIGGVLLGKDRVALLAVGRIVMGADLSKIRPSDVKVEGSKITVRVPKPTVIAIELLPDRSRIFDSERSWLFSQYEGLEVEALDEAKRKLNDAAKTNTQMLKLAESLTRLQLTELLRKAGYTDVVIEFVDAK